MFILLREKAVAADRLHFVQEQKKTDKKVKAQPHYSPVRHRRKESFVLNNGLRAQSQAGRA